MATASASGIWNCTLYRAATSSANTFVYTSVELTDLCLSHQVLQHLQRNTVIQHMYGIGMPEGMWRYRYGERHVVGCCGFNRFIQLGPDRPVGNFPDMRFLYSASKRIAMAVLTATEHPAPPLRLFYLGKYHGFARLITIQEKNI